MEFRSCEEGDRELANRVPVQKEPAASVNLLIHVQAFKLLCAGL